MKLAWALMLAAATPGASDWEQTGRPLPRREAVAVRLDPRLPSYRPCRTGLKGRREGSVTTILPDLFARWIRHFSRQQPDIAITASPPFGPPQGKLSLRLRAFLEGKSDFALVSRALTPDDLATFRRAHGSEPVVVQVAAGTWRQFGFVDTVVVVVNQANPIRRISFAEIDALFSAGRLRRHAALRDWGDLGAMAWAGRPIHIVGGETWLREDSARSAVVRSRVLLGGAWSDGLQGSGDEAAAPERVAADPLAIAITGLGHLPPGTRTLSISAMPHGPFVAPGFAQVSHNRYPLSRTVDLLLARRSDGNIDPLLAEFTRFAISREGQHAVAEEGVFLPLREEQAAASRALIGSCSGR